MAPNSRSRVEAGIFGMKRREIERSQRGIPTKLKSFERIGYIVLVVGIGKIWPVLSWARSKSDVIRFLLPPHLVLTITTAASSFCPSVILGHNRRLRDVSYERPVYVYACLWWEAESWRFSSSNFEMPCSEVRLSMYLRDHLAIQLNHGHSSSILWSNGPPVKRNMNRTRYICTVSLCWSAQLDCLLTQFQENIRAS